MKKVFSLFAAAFICGTSFAQIPNAGFENWTTTSGYDVPTDWDQLNALTDTVSVYTCTKGTPGNPGSSYIKLVSKTITGLGVAPGIACSGLLNVSSLASFAPKSGFANTARPVSLTGNWQYMAYGSDQGYISVLLSKWNTATSTRDTVAYTKHVLPGMVMSWASFTIPLTYYTGDVPDSALIVLSASGNTPVNNSYLYVDNLAFTGTVPAGLGNITANAASFTVYPNPANTVATIGYTAATGGTVQVVLTDIFGRRMLAVTKNVAAGTNQLPLDIAGYAAGLYHVTIIDGHNTASNTLIVE